MNNSISSFLKTKKPKIIYKILFREKEDWKEAIIKNLKEKNYQFDFALFNNNMSYKTYDFIIPLSIDDQKFINDNTETCFHNYLIPSNNSISIANDKSIFNIYLMENNFGKYIPSPAFIGQYPYILKKKISEFGKDCYIIECKDDEIKYSEYINDNENYYLQSIISGENEFTTHVIYFHKIKFDSTYQFTYPNNIFIKGYKSTGREIKKISTLFLNLWSDILRSMDYLGIGCFNYKIINNQPMIFEFNPRFGSTLIDDLSQVIELLMKVKSKYLLIRKYLPFIKLFYGTNNK